MKARTKQVIKRRNTFFVLSVLSWVIPAVVMVFSALIKFTGGDDGGGAEEAKESLSIFSEQVKTFALSLSTTAVVAILASIIIKDKIRTFIWMVTTILSAIVYGSVAMYIVLGLWLVEEYVFHALYEHYKVKVSINREIDLR